MCNSQIKKLIQKKLFLWISSSKFLIKPDTILSRLIPLLGGITGGHSHGIVGVHFTITYFHSNPKTPILSRLIHLLGGVRGGH